MQSSNTATFLLGNFLGSQWEDPLDFDRVSLMWHPWSISMLTYCNHLLHCDRFCQVPWTVNIAVPENSNVVGEELHWDYGENTLQQRLQQVI